uniref:C-X-C motif chemokine n=1 Tax=Pelusios castaneus TaxID=367368 RepID=A0A8C8RXB4_9SAUR
MGTCLVVLNDSLGALLAEFLSLSPGAPMAGELRCQCVETTSEVIHPKLIAQVELIPEGPHCDVAEVIATTKHGRQVCLDPTAPWVKLIIKKILNRYLHQLNKTSPSSGSGVSLGMHLPVSIVQ